MRLNRGQINIINQQQKDQVLIRKKYLIRQYNKRLPKAFTSSLLIAKSNNSGKKRDYHTKQLSINNFSLRKKSSIKQFKLINKREKIVRRSKMGNQHSINKSGDSVVFQNDGKFITPNKLYHAQTGQQQAIVNNIFGINDPTLLTRSYWAKEQSRSPYNKNDLRQQSRSRLCTDSLIRTYHQFEPQFAGHFQDNLDKRQQFKKSVLTDLRIEQGNQSRQFRNLSKNTSYSIIHKLKSEDDNRAQSPFKNSQLSKPTDLRYSKFTKDKENFNYLLGSGNKNNSQTKTNKKQLQRSVSQFKGVHKQSNQSSRRKVLDDVTLKSKITNIFGLQSIPQQNSGQLTDRLEEELKSMRNCEVAQLKSRITERTFKKDENQQKNWPNPKENPSRAQHEFSQQTFSRFQQHNVCPVYLSKEVQKQVSERISQKTVSRKSNMQRYKGLNQDSQNESLMKVMKRLTDLNLPMGEEQIQKLSRGILIEECQNENGSSQILGENINYQQYEQNHDRSSRKSSEKYSQQYSRKPSEKSIEMSNQKYSQKQSQKSSQKYQQNSKKSNFEFDLHEVKCSQKAGNSQMHIQSKSRISQLFESNQGSKKSLGGGLSSKSSHKHPISNNTHNDHYDPSSVYNHYYPENDIYNTESSQGFDDGYSQKFHFPRNLSPRSLAQQQRTMIRQRSCSGRLIQTSSKVSEKSRKQTQNCSKNFDFSKKSHHQNQDLPIYSRNRQSQESSKFSKLSTKDFSLMLKIQSLQEELKILKEKQEQGKFQSRRYSPVRQQRMKVLKGQDIQTGSETEQELELEKSKYCINDVSCTKPLKRRSQYFRLKIK